MSVDIQTARSGPRTSWAYENRSQIESLAHLLGNFAGNGAEGREVPSGVSIEQGIEGSITVVAHWAGGPTRYVITKDGEFPS